MKFKNILIKIIISSISLLMIEGFFTSEVTSNSIQKEHSITATANPLNRCESLKNFSANLLKKGYQPIEVTIENNTDIPYHISTESFSRETLSKEEVLDLLQNEQKEQCQSWGCFFLSAFRTKILPISDLVSLKNHNILNQKNIRKASLFALPYQINLHKIFKPLSDIKKRLLDNKLEQDKTVAPNTKERVVVVVPSESPLSSFQIQFLDLDNTPMDIKNLEVITK